MLVKRLKMKRMKSESVFGGKEMMLKEMVQGEDLRKADDGLDMFKTQTELKDKAKWQFHPNQEQKLKLSLTLTRNSSNLRDKTKSLKDSSLFDNSVLFTDRNHLFQKKLSAKWAEDRAKRIYARSVLTNNNTQNLNHNTTPYDFENQNMQGNSNSIL